MYPELRTSVAPDEREHVVLRTWKEKNIFRRSVDERPSDRIFSFYEGPPTVNGTPGIHHIFSRALKDVICRYKTMCGYRVERKAGWDTHGLPVEIAAEKELGFKHKHDIEEYGIGKFNELCRRMVYDLIGRDGGFNEFTERMAYWLDLSDPYITCTNDYVESVWWALKKFHDAGLIYKGFKIQPYCPRCETALSSHEVALGYKTAKDPSVFVKFKRKNVTEDEYFLAWTTTPWTLISNVALAMHPDVEYVTVLNTRKDRAPERLVLAKALIGKLEGEVEILAEHKGKDFEYQEYERLFDFVPVEGKAFYVVLGDYVTTEDGTGIVHTAPAFGEDDFQISRKYNLPVINPVDKTGSFAAIVTDFAGHFVKSADPAITENLKGRGLLYRKETIEHTYPFCWRCGTPLLYYARDSWYIRVTEYKQKLIAENQKINWQPPELRDGRFGNWLVDLKDWGISRERFWGTPLPIWVCDACDKQKCVGSAAELGREKDFDLHKPYVDEVTFVCDCGGTMRRTPEVIDVWFDSGAMPFAQHHFMGKDGERPPNYPADYISEGVDQTRGWFYTLHAINTFLFGEAPFRNVIVNDMLLDKTGQKMSKSKGNIVDPFAVMTKHGADATRWYLLSASVPWKPRSFNEDDLGELERKLFGTLLNTYGFFALYANIDKYKRDEAKVIPHAQRAEVDRWILSKLNSLVRSCREDFDAYEVTRPARAIQEYVIEQLSNWYIRRNRRRFWKGEHNADKQAAYDTLYECLMTVSKLMSPIAPFFSDLIYGALVGPFDSIHLDLYPEVNEAAIDLALERRMEAAQVASSLVRQMRERAKIRVRQPLGRMLIPVANRREIEELRKVEDVIREEVNVKYVDYVEAGDTDIIKLKAKANFKSLGAKLGKKMKAVAARVQTLTQEEIRLFQTAGSLPVDVDGESITLERGDIDVIAEDVEGWLVSSEAGMTVALDSQITPELEKEGLAREFVNRVQNLRKDSGFDVTDRISITLHSKFEEMQDAVRVHAAFIQQETLAESISSDGESLENAVTVNILEREVTIQLSRVR